MFLQKVFAIPSMPCFAAHDFRGEVVAETVVSGPVKNCNRVHAQLPVYNKGQKSVEKNCFFTNTGGGAEYFSSTIEPQMGSDTLKLGFPISNLSRDERVLSEYRRISEERVLSEYKRISGTPSGARCERSALYLFRFQLIASALRDHRRFLRFLKLNCISILEVLSHAITVATSFQMRYLFSCGSREWDFAFGSPVVQSRAATGYGVWDMGHGIWDMGLTIRIFLV